MKKEKDEWHSDYFVSDKHKIRIPLWVYGMFRQIARETDDEYAICFQINDGKIMDNIWSMPKQVVSRASVEIESNSPTEFNCIIHRHPDNCNDFSQTDWDYINTNYEYSYIWTQSNGFVKGCKKIETDGQHIWIESVPDIDWGYTEGLMESYEENVSKITSKDITNKLIEVNTWKKPEKKEKEEKRLGDKVAFEEWKYNCGIIIYSFALNEWQQLEPTSNDVLAGDAKEVNGKCFWINKSPMNRGSDYWKEQEEMEKIVLEEDYNYSKETRQFLYDEEKYWWENDLYNKGAYR